MRPLDRRAGHLGEALEFFAEMKPARVRPTVVTFTTLIAAYSEAGDPAQQPHRCGINPPPTAMPHGHRANPDPEPTQIPSQPRSRSRCRHPPQPLADRPLQAFRSVVLVVSAQGCRIDPDTVKSSSMSLDYKKTTNRKSRASVPGWRARRAAAVQMAAGGSQVTSLQSDRAASGEKPPHLPQDLPTAPVASRSGKTPISCPSGTRN